jgi:hypothetical protein
VIVRGTFNLPFSPPHFTASASSLLLPPSRPSSRRPPPSPKEGGYRLFDIRPSRPTLFSARSAKTRPRIRVIHSAQDHPTRSTVIFTNQKGETYIPRGLCLSAGGPCHLSPHPTSSCNYPAHHRSASGFHSCATSAPKPRPRSTRRITSISPLVRRAACTGEHTTRGASAAASK